MTVQQTLEVLTRGRGTHEITKQIQEIVSKSGVNSGLCNLFLQHTSASLILCENADPDVQRDLEAFAQRMVPDGDPMFVHTMEGPDDMPAHIRTVLTNSFLTIPVKERKCLLGTWQGIYLWEHRFNSHKRTIVITLIGE
ncbi:MAG: secondary thiamine-phosphate synthase enzyme YjbQ [Gammaproteobacteria bacterium]